MSVTVTEQSVVFDDIYRHWYTAFPLLSSMLYTVTETRTHVVTVFLWLTPTFLPDTYWLQECGRWVHALIFYLSIVFSWV